MMRAAQGFAGKIVERGGHAFGDPTRVDEDDGAAMRAHEFKDARVNRGPD